MLTKEDTTELAHMMEGLISRFKTVPGTCLQMSSLLAACINDHTNVNANVVAGSLTVGGISVFSDSPIIPTLDAIKVNSFGSWDGHSWVEVPGLILDPSIFRTIYSAETPTAIKELFFKRFGTECNYLMSQSHKLHEIDVIYTSKEKLRKTHVDMFIKSADAMGAI